MSFRSSNSLAVLALVAGCFAPCASPLTAQGGDKIEFSAPSASLDIPRVQREEKEPAKSAFDRSIRPDEAVLAEQMQDSTEVVVITRPKKKTTRIWDSALTDNRDDTADANSREDSLDHTQRPINGATNLWDMDKGWNQNTGHIYSERRADDPVKPESLRARLEAMNTARTTYYQKDNRFDRRPSDSDEDSSWSRNLFHHGFLGMGETREPFYDDVKPMNAEPSQAYLSVRPSSAADDALRDSKLPPGMVEYNSQVDVLRGKTPEEMLTAPALRPYQPVETKTVSQNPDPYARQQPPASPPGQVQSPPAILPFPRRPGSVFQ